MFTFEINGFSVLLCANGDIFAVWSSGRPLTDLYTWVLIESSLRRRERHGHAWKVC